MPLITLLLNKHPKFYVSLLLHLLLKKLECFTYCIMVLLVYSYFLTPLQLRHKDSRSIARKYTNRFKIQFMIRAKILGKKKTDFFFSMQVVHTAAS